MIIDCRQTPCCTIDHRIHSSCVYITLQSLTKKSTFLSFFLLQSVVTTIVLAFSFMSSVILDFTYALRSYGIYYSMKTLFHLTCPPGLSHLLQMTGFLTIFLRLKSIPLCICTRFSLSSLLMDS